MSDHRDLTPPKRDPENWTPVYRLGETLLDASVAKGKDHAQTTQNIISLWARNAPGS
jgi:hypothetical protein